MLKIKYTAGTRVSKGKPKYVYPPAKKKSSPQCHTPHERTQCMPMQACFHRSGSRAMPISVSCDGVFRDAALCLVGSGPQPPTYCTEAT